MALMELTTPTVQPVAVDETPVRVELAAAASRHVTPEMIRPFPKAPPRKKPSLRRRTGRSRVLTDTPVKKELEELQRRRKRKLSDVETEPTETVSKIASKRLKFSRRQSTDQSCSKNQPSAKGKTKQTRKSRPASEAFADAPCLYCGEMWSQSHEQFIKCQGHCQEWAHVSCAGVDITDKNFVCERC